MNTEPELTLLNEIISHKKHGYSILRILRRQLIRHILLFLLVFACVYLYSIEVFSKPFSALMIGLLIGSAAQQLTFLIKSKKVWTLYERIIDWQLVNSIGDSANKNLEPISKS